MSEWLSTNIGAICQKVVSGGTPLTSNHNYYQNGDISWLKTKEVNQSRIYSTENHITQLGVDNSSAKLIPVNSVVIAMYGDGKTAGRVGLTKIPLTTNQACCNLIFDEDKTHPEFVFYYLLGSYDELVARKTGSGQQNLNAQLIKAFEIPIPSLTEQKAIASVLSSLDDKIDLLHRQNTTLERMAETLFRQWFVEEAQEDWEVVPLGNLFEISSGKGLKKEQLSDTGLYPVLGANGEIGKTNDFLFNEKLIFTGRVGTLGNIFRVNNENVWLSDNTLIFRNIKYFYFVYFALNKASLADYNVGSTQPLIRQSDIKSIEIYLPKNQEYLNKFETEADLIFAKINSNSKQIQTLEKLRDNLLPKLMSGELRVEL